MHKYIISITVFLLTIFQLSTFALDKTATKTHFAQTAHPSFKYVPTQLQPVVAKLLELPEARQLLTQVSREGPVSIVLENDPQGQFDAMWDGDARQIKVNAYRHPNEGTWICSLLFELHNASTNKHMLKLFTAAENNQMSKETWVEQMERMEHSNALNTCRLLEKGISQGLYPKEAQWTIFHLFDDYYKLQQITDHSLWLANHYDSLNPYSSKQRFQGTVAGLHILNAEDKKDLQNYLVIKNNLESPNQQEALKNLAWLKNEYTQLEECSQGKRREGCFRSKEKIKLMRIVFGDTAALKTKLQPIL